MNQFVWKIKKGDLVRLKIHSNSGCEDDFNYEQGIVVSHILKEENAQIPLWPYVKVYVFKTGTIDHVGPANIEILSNS
jgi:hypothetical protein